jgi:regulatory protein
MPEAVEQIIERLTELKYLDDLEFARFWVRNREEFRPRGPAALRAELRQKGISNDIINEVLSNFEAEDSAWRAARKKARSMRKLDEQTFRRRLTGFLARRGFSYGTARPIVDQLIEERESDADNEENSHYDSDPIEE